MLQKMNSKSWITLHELRWNRQSLPGMACGISSSETRSRLYSCEDLKLMGFEITRRDPEKPDQQTLGLRVGGRHLLNRSLPQSPPNKLHVLRRHCPSNGREVAPDLLLIPKPRDRARHRLRARRPDD